MKKLVIAFGLASAFLMMPTPSQAGISVFIDDKPRYAPVVRWPSYWGGYPRYYVSDRHYHYRDRYKPKYRNKYYDWRYRGPRKAWVPNNRHHHH